jgi:hypothetical protein
MSHNTSCICCCGYFHPADGQDKDIELQEELRKRQQMEELAQQSMAEMQQQLHQARLNEHRRFEDIWNLSIPRVRPSP